MYELTEAEAFEIKGKEYTKDMYFNPIQDAQGGWVVSIEEVDNCDNELFVYLKTKDKIDFFKKVYDLKRW